MCVIIAKSTHEVTHNYNEAHTFHQTCRHSGIVALRVFPPLGSEPVCSICVTWELVFLGMMTQVRVEKLVEGPPLGDMRRGGWVSPETPTTLGVLLAQDLLLALALLLRAQIAILFFQEPHRRPALLLKVPLVFYKEWRQGYLVESIFRYALMKLEGE